MGLLMAYDRYWKSVLSSSTSATPSPAGHLADPLCGAWPSLRHGCEDRYGKRHC
jgi:hypothetical protein